MFPRKIVTVSAAAIAAVALSVPLVHAQGEGADTGSVDVGSLQAGNDEGGSLASASGDEGGAAGNLGSVEGEDGGSAGSADGGASELAPTTAPDATCDLPDLGGSVAKFYPLFGLTDLPSGVMDIITSALDSFPNILDMVVGDGAALLGQAGSLAEPLCTSIFGGEMAQPPVTVIVDGDGNPVTTVTGTPAADSASVPGLAGAEAVTSTRVSDSGTADAAEGKSDDASDYVGDAGHVDGGGAGAGAGAGVLPTSVPIA